MRTIIKFALLGLATASFTTPLDQRSSAPHPVSLETASYTAVYDTGPPSILYKIHVNEPFVQGCPPGVRDTISKAASAGGGGLLGLNCENSTDGNTDLRLAVVTATSGLVAGLQEVYPTTSFNGKNCPGVDIPADN